MRGVVALMILAAFVGGAFAGQYARVWRPLVWVSHDWGNSGSPVGICKIESLTLTTDYGHQQDRWTFVCDP